MRSGKAATACDGGSGEVILAEAFPPRKDTAQPVTWDLRPHAGRTALLEIVDGDDGAAYAWLAAGRLEPAVVALPAVDPRAIASRGQMAAGIAERLRLDQLRPQLVQTIGAADIEPGTRAAAARAVGAIDGNAKIAAIAPFVGMSAVPDALRKRTRTVIAAAGTTAIDELILDTLRSVPASVQSDVASTTWAAPLASARVRATYSWQHRRYDPCDPSSVTST